MVLINWQNMQKHSSISVSSTTVCWFVHSVPQWIALLNIRFFKTTDPIMFSIRLGAAWNLYFHIQKKQYYSATYMLKSVSALKSGVLFNFTSGKNALISMLRKFSGFRESTKQEKRIRFTGCFK